MTDNKQANEKTESRIDRIRAKSPFLDHLLRMNEHYGKVEGNVLAGAVTYFGFLSFFPILALAFAVIGYVSIAYPDARDSLVEAIESIFPGIVSPTDEEGKISLADIESAKAAAGLIGFAGVLYSGLGWISGLRLALQDAFVVPQVEKPNFVKGKAVDLLALGIIGFVLIVSVGLSGVAQGTTDKILDFLGLDVGGIGAVLVWSIGFALGLVASTVLIFVMFRLLGSPDEIESRDLLRGALLGAIGFELLKLLVIYVLGGVGGSAFAPLAIAITLVVWINYFSRLVMYGACWAFTSVPATSRVAAREAESVLSNEAAVVGARTEVDTDDEGEPRPRGRFDLGSAVVGGVAGAVAAVVLRSRG